MKIIDRLAEFIRFKGISLNAFDKSMGLSNGYIGKQINNKASIGSDILENIFCTYPDLSIVWLMSGRGEMIDKAAESIIDPGMDPPDCEKCKMREELIDSLYKRIDLQSKVITMLEDKKCPEEDGQKRKAAS